jgi:RNA polymerase sigma-70 factor (ECF subfamily)
VDEKALLEKAQAGDREALGELLMAHREACYALALRMTDNAADAEDVCQDAFVRASRDLVTAGPVGNLSSWLFKLVVHSHGRRARSEGARRRREGRRAVELETTAPSAAGNLERTELRHRLDQSLGQLDEDYRLPIVLHYERGLSYADAAAVLDIPEGTVATNIRRGLEELRGMMAKAGYGAAGAGAGAGAVEATLSQAPAVSVPASLTAFVKSLAASGGVKAAGTAAATTSVGSLALGWKLAAGLSLAAVLGAAFFGLRTHGQPAAAPPAVPGPAAPTPVVSISAVLDRQVTIDKKHMTFIELANKLDRDVGLKFAVASGYGRSNVRLEPGKVRVGDLLDSLAKGMDAELEVRELHGGACAIFWSRPEPELLASLGRLALSADETERCAAALWLPALGCRAGLEFGAKLLADRSPRVRQYAAFGIGRSWQLMSHRGGEWLAMDTPLPLLSPPEASRAVAEDINRMAEAPSELAWHRFESLARVAAALRLEAALPGLRKVAEHQLDHPQFYNDGKGHAIDVHGPGEPVAVLCRIGGADADSFIAGLFKKASDAQKATMALTLADTDTPQIRQLLISALDDKNPAVVRSAARSLGLIGAREAEEPLMKVLGKRWEPPAEGAFVPQSLILALLRIDAAKHVDSAKKTMSGLVDPWQRIWFCSVLSKEPSAGAWLAPYAEEFIGPDKEQVRRQALDVLARVGTDRSVARIAVLFGHKDASVKRAACAALSGIGGPAAAEALQKALKSDDAELRAAACWAIVDLEDESLVRSLLEPASRDSDAKVRAQAADSLRYCERVGKTETLKPSSAKRALAGIEGKLRDLRSRDAATRLAAIRGDPGIEPCDPRLVAPLCTLVASDPDAKVRLSAARVFSPPAGSFVDPAVAPSALKALNEDKDMQLRSKALNGLIMLGLTKRPDVTAAMEAYRRSIPKDGLKPSRPQPAPIPAPPEVF